MADRQSNNEQSRPEKDAGTPGQTNPSGPPKDPPMPKNDQGVGAQNSPEGENQISKFRRVLLELIKASEFTDWVVAVCTIVLCGTAIAQCSATKGQLTEMRAQLTEMKAATKVADINAKAAERAAKAAEDAIKSGVDAARTDQRAWVTVTSIHTLGDFSDDKNSKFEVIAKNTGQTPAISVRAWTASVYTGYAIQGIDELRKLRREAGELKETMSGIAAPDVPMYVEMTTDASIYPTLKKELGDRPFYLNVFGRIEYRDIFGSEHFTEFYFYRTSAARKDEIGFSVGAFGNETDESKKTETK